MEQNKTRRFLATCAGGLESLVADEIKGWGGEVQTCTTGSVGWSGSLESGYRACLWSRFSSRILLIVRESDLQSVEDLYEQARTTPWEEHLRLVNHFAVDCSIAGGSPIKHSKFAALRVKDGVADRFRERTGQRPDVQVRRPDVRLNVHIRAGLAVLAVDLSGESLHRRGYRSSGGVAPLKESLAAAIVAWSGWTGDGPLIDPLCGSATLLIEAALLLSDSAPGLGRSYFGLTNWLGHDQELWERLVEEARAREAVGQDRLWPPLLGYDADDEVIAVARENIKRAGLEDRIVVRCRELCMLQPEETPGWVVCNPPYGERLSGIEHLRYLYRFLGIRLRESFNGWTLALFTAVPEYADLLQIPWRDSRRLFNGPLSCGLFVGSVPPPEPDFHWQIKVGEPIEAGRDLVNRLKKNLDKRLAWAREHGVECFRIYDRDLPDYNVSIELYRKWVYIREFPSPKTIDRNKAEERCKTAVSVVRSLLGVGWDRLFIDRRSPKSVGTERPIGRRAKGDRCEVGEGRGRFLLDFSRGSCLGLALDQRSARLRLGMAAKNKAFLNLIDQAGAATVHTAIGGARRTTTVVPTAEQRERTAWNFALNGMYAPWHRIVVGDYQHWLDQDGDTYDLIYANIRTAFSSKKRAGGFDLRQHHGDLIRTAMRRLRQDGTLLLTTGLRPFKLDPALAEQFSCRSLDGMLLPRDFERSSGIYRYWEIRHQSGGSADTGQCLDRAARM